MAATELEELRTDVTRPAPATRRLWVWLGVLALAAAAVIVSRRGGQSATAAGTRGSARPVPVVTASARAGEVPVYLRGLGTVTAFNTAVIKSRVDGQLVSVAFREGQYVQEGQLLVEIDPRPFQVQIQQAEGALARDEAAQRDAQIIYDRDKALFDQQIVARQDLDSQKARVDQLLGSIETDKAQLANARLQLTYSRITAPFAGRVGLRLVDPGNIVHATDPTGLLVLTQLHPIAVLFSLPQDDLGNVLHRLKANEDLPVETWDRDDAKKLATGKLLTIDNQIDPTTGTYKLKAVLDNKDDALFPNQFVNVRLHVDTKKDVVLVPAVALQRGPQGYFAYVVDGEQKAHVRQVKVALFESQEAATTDGLKDGDKVVIEGQDKLQEGSAVDLGTRAGAPGEGGAKREKGGGKAKGASQ